MRLQNGETRRFNLRLNSLLWSRWRWRGAGDVKADTSLVTRMLHFAQCQSNHPNNNTSLNCFSCYSQICVVTLFLKKQSSVTVTWSGQSLDHTTLQILLPAAGLLSAPAVTPRHRESAGSQSSHERGGRIWAQSKVSAAWPNKPVQLLNKQFPSCICPTKHLYSGWSRRCALTTTSSSDDLRHLFRKMLLADLSFLQFMLWHCQDVLSAFAKHSYRLASIHVYLYGCSSHQGNSRSGRTRETFFVEDTPQTPGLERTPLILSLTQQSQESRLGKTITWGTWIKLILNLRPLKPGNGGEFKNPVGSDSVFILVMTFLLLRLFLSSHKDGAGGQAGGRAENKV